MKATYDFARHVELTGSHKRESSARRLTQVQKDKPCSVTLLLRSKQPLPDLAYMDRHQQFKRMSHQNLWKNHGGLVKDLEIVTAFAHHFGLTVVSHSIQSSLVELRGSIRQMEEAFHVQLSQYITDDDKVFSGRQGPIHIPESLQEIVVGVFGLDDRPVATPKFQINKNAKPSASIQYDPTQLATVYNFPKATGKGQVIGIIELGGGYHTQDLNNYFKELNLPTPNVIPVSVDGGVNSPSTPDSADSEVVLDIEVAGAIAPDATVVVYFAPNTDKGFLDAINAAVHDTVNKPDIISISWGAPEAQWTAQSLNAFNKAFNEAVLLGITVFAAAGDQGSSDGLRDGMAHVDFPASSPYVVSCGGTTLIAKEKVIEKETVWNDGPASATGGGISDVFPVPSYQQNLTLPPSANSSKRGRGLPDLAAVADPQTGYTILVDGEKFIIGGTSAVAPLMSGMLARINEKIKRNVGFLHPQLYTNVDICRDINEGDNITVADGKGYRATLGWDACTGNGVPDGTKLLEVL